MTGNGTLRRLDRRLTAWESRLPVEPEPGPACPVRELQARLATLFAPCEEHGWRGSFGMGQRMRHLLWPAWQTLCVLSRLSWLCYWCPKLVEVAAAIVEADKEWVADRTGRRDWFPLGELTLHEFKAAVAQDYPDGIDPTPPRWDYVNQRPDPVEYGAQHARAVSTLVSDLPPWHKDFPAPGDWPAGVRPTVEAALEASLSKTPAVVEPFDWREVPTWLYHWPFPRDPRTGSPLESAIGWMSEPETSTSPSEEH